MGTFWLKRDPALLRLLAGLSAQTTSHNVSCARDSLWEAWLHPQAWSQSMRRLYSAPHHARLKTCGLFRQAVHLTLGQGLRLRGKLARCRSGGSWACGARLGRGLGGGQPRGQGGTPLRGCHAVAEAQACGCCSAQGCRAAQRSHRHTAIMIHSLDLLQICATPADKPQQPTHEEW